MKKFLVLLLLLLSYQPAIAASKPLTQIGVVEGDGLFIDKSTIYTFGTTESLTSDAFISAYDGKGILQLRKVIDGGGSEYISAVSSDGVGNFWLVGGDTLPTPSTSVDSRTSTAVNPDSSTVEAIPAQREDIKNIVLWKFTPATQSITRYALNYGSSILATAISADSKGISIVAYTLVKGVATNLLINVKSSGEFGQPITVGNKGSTINGVQRQSDGSIVLIGSISEKLGSATPSGKRDAILIKVTNNKVAQIAQSTAKNGEREWLSIGSSTFLAGTTKVGKNIQVAVTKFANFKPVWNFTYPSTGSAVGFLNSSGAYLAYGTSQGISLNAYSTKGVLGNIYLTPGAQTPLGLAYSKELGLVLLATSGNQSFLFTPTSG